MEALGAVIAGTGSVDELLERRRRAGRDRQIEAAPKITIDNELSDSYTVIEVKCPDRVGLLYLITRTLSRLELDIASARIATEIDQAYDSFYVHDRHGRKLEDAGAMDRVREGLEQALLQPL
jgi:[protein-PII] uridylyltransferase